MTEGTIYHLLQSSVRRYGQRPALGFKQGGELREIRYDELWERVRRWRRGLAALGVSKGDRIALLSENRAEWAITDLAAQSLGIVTVPIYPTLPAAQVQYIVGDSAARILIVSDRKQLAKAIALRPHVRTLDHIVLMDGDAPDDVLTFAEVAHRGDDTTIRDADLDAQAATITPDDVATLIYTSGTTGDPKGAVLTHRNLLHTGKAAREIVTLDETDTFLSFLPLCHIIERVGGHYLPLSLGARIVYSEGVFAIAEELPTVRPTVFLCVPRLYESMQEKVAEHIAKMPDRRRKLVQWALGVGGRAVRRELTGMPIGAGLRLQRAVADRLVLRRLRERLTGGRARFFVSGGAPLSPATAEFFESLGVRILEGYGLTELPVITLNRPEKRRLATVGLPLPGLEVTIAPDSEILARGPSLMRGYFGRPEATAEAIDEEGWFHTGDIGELTPEGFLRITDRKKDIIVLANGKNVAPQPIEARLKSSPLIAEAVLIGDRQTAVTALLVPAFDVLRAWAREQDLPADDTDALLGLPQVRKRIKDEIDAHSQGLADFERVKRFTLIDHPFSIDTGELTPTLKVKRRFIAETYAAAIEQMAR